jgi:hypothetical protein
VRPRGRRRRPRWRSSCTCRATQTGLTRFVGVSASQAQRYAGRWIALQSGDQVGYASYDTVAQGLTLSGEATTLAMTAPETLTGAITLAGQRVIGVSGALPASDGFPAGTQQVLYTTDNASLQLVEATLVGGSIAARWTYSRWGEPVDVTAPADSVPAAALTPGT